MVMKAKDYVLKFVSRRLGIASACVTGILSLPDPHWAVVVAKVLGLAWICRTFIICQSKEDEQKIRAAQG
jgi:hypothetical protein